MCRLAQIVHVPALYLCYVLTPIAGLAWQTFSPAAPEFMPPTLTELRRCFTETPPGKRA